MKHIQIIVLLMVVYSGIAQVPSNCNVPPELAASYDVDVSYLALERIRDVTPNSNSIVIPQTFKDTIWEGLAAIYNATSIPERDSVFDIYCIHQYKEPHKPILCGRDSINLYYNIYFDSSYSWTRQWADSQLITGYQQLDTLLITYGFKLIWFSEYFGRATFSTTQVINWYALRDSLKTLDGVISASALPDIGCFNRLEYDINGSSREYKFILGYGQDVSWCDAFYAWNFNVDFNCAVTFTGVDIDTGNWNYPFPIPTNCNLSNNCLLEICNIDWKSQCPNICDGLFSFDVSNGVSPINYYWSNGDTGSTITGLCAGTYYLTVIDSNNCSLNIKVNIHKGSSTSLSFSTTPDTGTQNGSIIVSVSGGHLPFTYLWSDSSTNDTLTNLSAGIYYVTVTDFSGCETIDSVKVNYTPPCESVIANFEYSISNQDYFDRVTFTNTSYNDSSWEWYFGDGFTTKVVENPSHNYTKGFNGFNTICTLDDPISSCVSDFKVCLIVWNSCSRDTICDTLEMIKWCCNITDVEEHNSNQLSVIQFENKLIINNTNYNSSEDIYLRIYDINGREIESAYLNGNRINYTLKDVNSGIYIAVVENIRQRVVKRLVRF